MGREGGQPTQQEWRAIVRKMSYGENLEIIDKWFWEHRMCHRGVEGPVSSLRRNSIWMKLRILKAKVPKAEDEVTEDEVAEDEVGVIYVMWKRAQTKLGNTIGMTVFKKGAKEIGLSQKWNVLGVASMATTQENADWQTATTMARLVI